MIGEAIVRLIRAVTNRAGRSKTAATSVKILNAGHVKCTEMPVRHLTQKRCSLNIQIIDWPVIFLVRAVASIFCLSWLLLYSFQWIGTVLIFSPLILTIICKFMHSATESLNTCRLSDLQNNIPITLKWQPSHYCLLLFNFSIYNPVYPRKIIAALAARKSVS